MTKTSRRPLYAIRMQSGLDLSCFLMIVILNLKIIPCHRLLRGRSARCVALRRYPDPHLARRASTQRRRARDRLRGSRARGQLAGASTLRGPDRAALIPQQRDHRRLVRGGVLLHRYRRVSSARKFARGKRNFSATNPYL